MEPGRTTPLTPAEFEQVVANAPNKSKHYAEWRDLDDKLHREGDLPAVVRSDGGQTWCWHGILHRDGDLPARVGADGSLSWGKHGELHRDNDLPARVFKDGLQYYQHGKLHRDGDLPAVERNDGAKSWRKHGKIHRDGNLPAIIYVKGTPRQQYKNEPDTLIEIDGAMEWFVDGERTGDQDNPPPGAVFPGHLTKSASKQ